MENKQKFKRQSFLSWEIMEDGLAVVIDEQEGKVFNLNRVGTEIWKRLDGSHNKEAILQEITDLFEGSEKKIRKESEKFIESLYQKDLIKEA